MEETKVPWWRKALNFALSGIRSGFGIFSRPQKSDSEIESEIAAEDEQIREESELTEHFPEQISTTTVTEAVAASPALDVEAAASLEASAHTETAPVAQPEEVPAVETEAAAEPSIADPAPEPESNDEPPEDSEAAVETDVNEVDMKPEPDVAVEPVSAIEEPVEITAEEVFAEPEIETPASGEESAIPEEEPPAEPEQIVEVVVAEPALETAAESSIEPEAESVKAFGQAEENSAQEQESPVEVETETAAEPEIEARAEETVPESPAEREEAAQAITEESSPPEDAAIVEENAIEEPAVAAPEVLAESEAVVPKNAEQPVATEELAQVEDAWEAVAPEPAGQMDAGEVPEPVEAPEPAVEETEPEPMAVVAEEPALPVTEELSEEPSEHEEEQPLAIENESVDEVTPEAEAAISEDLASESASPVPDELLEPVAQTGGDSSGEPNESAANTSLDQRGEDVPAEEVVEQASDDQLPEEPISDQPMELNRQNPDADAEPEQPVETTSPVEAAADSVAAPDACTEAPSEAGPTLADAPETHESPATPHPSKPFIKREPREGDVNGSPFSVIVSQVYDGPLDLLLDLIRKQDIDIYDIPISRITAQFLAYVNQLKSSDVDVAGEFIYTASLLIHIKSKMLLPRAPSGPDDAAEDPRRELVERLLEHERFKNAAQMLQQKQMLEAATWTNPGVREFKEDTGAEPEIAADTVDLVRVFRDILERARNRPVLNLQEDSVTVGQMIQFLSRRLTMEDKPIALRKLLSHSRSERALIAMFLALLELVRLQAILLRQDIAFSEIFIKKHSNFEIVMTESTARDDWQ
jgi:segregation and condensation protein A